MFLVIFARIFGIQIQYFFKYIRYARDELFYTPISFLNYIIPQGASQHLVNLKHDVSKTKLWQNHLYQLINQLISAHK